MLFLCCHEGVYVAINLLHFSHFKIVLPLSSKVSYIQLFLSMFLHAAKCDVLFSAEKLRLQEELFRLRSHRKENESRREHLLNKARVLQARASKFKAKVRFEN